MVYYCRLCKLNFGEWRGRTCPECGSEEENQVVPKFDIYFCHECGKLTDDPHTSSEGEDVCEACCDLCKHIVKCPDPECGWTGPESEADLNDFGERRCPECDCGNPLLEVTP